MNTHPSIERSRRVYAALLALYPREHRAAYGADMLQLFTDQRRAVNRRRGLLALWLRTLLDLGVSALREQLSAPHRTLGLLEAPPNAPLPWKGVALVLLPGLIVFISQVAQLTGEDWFFLLAYRGAFYLILPVLLVWAWKRRFPIWGLMPLGLLAQTLLTLGYKIQYGWLERQKQWQAALRSLNRGLVLPVTTQETLRVVVIVSMALACLGLGWWVLRRVGIPRRAWAWLGAYLLLVAAALAVRVWRIVLVNADLHDPAATFQAILPDFAYQYLFNYIGFLALILCGALLARRHGLLAMLLPLGYLLPTVLFGRMIDEWPGASSPDYAFLLMVGASALVYRFLVGLAGPLWITRSAGGQMQKRSSMVSLVTLIVIQAACNFALLFYYFGSANQPVVIYLTISEQLIIGAGIALALALYRPLQPEPRPQPGPLSAQAR